MSSKKSTNNRLSDKTPKNLNAAGGHSILRDKPISADPRSLRSDMTMEQLLQSTGYNIPILKRGQDVKGKIISVTKSEILVDIGAKSEGIIYAKEIAAAGDLVSNLAVGDLLEATVVYPENDAGQVVLSLKKLSGVKRWNELVEKTETGEPIDVTVLEVNKGGFICEFYGLRGFLPVSHLSSNLRGDLVGRRLNVQVIEADKATARLIFSQKPQEESKNKGEILKLLEKVTIGETYNGIVSAILPFGIFVEIEIGKLSVVGDQLSDSGQSVGRLSDSKTEKQKTDQLESEDRKLKTDKLEGLVHVSEISWEKTDDPTKQFTVGQSVEVAVIAKDAESGRLNLSIKQLSDDPFLEVSKQYSKGQNVRGKVSKVTPFGVFVILEAGVEGLIHISKISPDLVFEVRQEISCEIENIDTAAHRISLVPVAKAKPVLYR